MTEEAATETEAKTETKSDIADVDIDTKEKTDDIELSTPWVDEHEGFSADDKKFLSKFKTAEASHKAHIELESYRGRSIALPKDDDSDKDKAKQMGAIYDRLGRPKTPADYKIERPTDLPEGMEWNEEAEKQIRQHGHVQGWNQGQMQAAVNLYNEVRKQEIEILQKAADKAVKEATTALKADPDFGNGSEKTFKECLENARRAYDIYGGDDFVELMKQKGLNNHPAVIKTFNEIYKEKLAEGGLVGASKRGKKDEGGDFLNYDKVE